MEVVRGMTVNVGVTWFCIPTFDMDHIWPFHEYIYVVDEVHFESSNEHVPGSAKMEYKYFEL